MPEPFTVSEANLPTILLTNDDGIAAVGIAALHAALVDIGDVVTIAPRDDQSAVARGITIHRTLKVEEVAFGKHAQGYVVDGTPVDCVRVATTGLLCKRPDVVVSGINHGGNLGDDLTYSGTVAAALEGVLLGIPSVAVSVASTEPRFVHELAPLAAPFIAKVLHGGLPPRMLLNINFPDVPVGRLKGVRLASMGRASYHDSVVLIHRGKEREYPIARGLAVDRHETESDFAVVEEGYMSLTPVRFDLSASSGLHPLEHWDVDGMLLDALRGRGS